MWCGADEQDQCCGLGGQQDGGVAEHPAVERAAAAPDSQPRDGVGDDDQAAGHGRGQHDHRCEVPEGQAVDERPDAGGELAGALDAAGELDVRDRAYAEDDGCHAIGAGHRENRDHRAVGGYCEDVNGEDVRQDVARQ